MKPAHRRGNHSHRHAARIVNAANRDPDTQCWRCNNTLPNCRPMKDGTPSRWTAGHERDGDPTCRLLPECSRCNLEAGGKLTANRHGVTKPTRDWTKK